MKWETTKLPPPFETAPLYESHFLPPMPCRNKKGPPEGSPLTIYTIAQQPTPKVTTTVRVTGSMLRCRQSHGLSAVVLIVRGMFG